jgi:alkylation response protein AidB-like acyl-CoA dehydrogenase
MKQADLFHRQAEACANLGSLMYADLLTRLADDLEAGGVTIPGKIEKMGFKVVDTIEMVFEGHKISADQILGEPGKGFYPMRDGVEVGRVNVAACGYGFSKEYEIERLHREAPMLLIGEGTADIQRMIIGRRLLEDYKLR